MPSGGGGFGAAASVAPPVPPPPPPPPSLPEESGSRDLGTNPGSGVSPPESPEGEDPDESDEEGLAAICMSLPPFSDVPVGAFEFWAGACEEPVPLLPPDVAGFWGVINSSISDWRPFFLYESDH